MLCLTQSTDVRGKAESVFSSIGLSDFDTISEMEMYSKQLCIEQRPHPVQKGSRAYLVHVPVLLQLSAAPDPAMPDLCSQHC